MRRFQRRAASTAGPLAEAREAVTALIEPADGFELDLDAVIAVCRQALGSVKAPKRVIVRDLPRSAVGKILKKDLRAEY